MRRVREQCAAQRSTEAIAQPVARRPEAQRGTRPKINPPNTIKSRSYCVKNKKFYFKQKTR
ncbi:MAG: hypothetical protein NZ455_12040 [Bacteroidia bacterium]|nr:hypothetical protein [Bacteroidia bacterium]MDW8346641.1 hypothetical protein [Bacteroidia bacterium]